MKLPFNYHLYRIRPDEYSARQDQASGAGTSPIPANSAPAAAPGHEPQVPQVPQNRNGSVRFGLLLTKGKRPPLPQPPQSGATQTGAQPTVQSSEVPMALPVQTASAGVQHQTLYAQAGIQHAAQGISLGVQHGPESESASRMEAGSSSALAARPAAPRAAVRNDAAIAEVTPSPVLSLASQTRPPNLKDLPEELLLAIIKLLQPGDIKRVRLAWKNAARIGKNELRRLKVDRPEGLQEALRTFEDSRILSLALSGNFLDAHFRKKELQNLMAQALGSLEVFSTSGCHSLYFDGISTAVQHMPALKELDLSGPTVGHFLRSPALAGILGSLQQLRKLKLSWANMMNGTHLSNALTSASSALTHLHLSDLNRLTDEGLAQVLQSKPNLRSLRLNDCRGLTSAGLVNALAHAHQLTQLDLSGMRQISNEQLANVLGQVPRLAHLALQRCSQFTAEGLAAALQNVSGLVHLDLYEADLSEDPDLAADPAAALTVNLAAVLQQVPALEYLDVSALQDLDDTRLAAALQHVPNLTHLELALLDELTDSGLAAALQHVPQLAHLNISLCSNLKNVRFPHLRRLETLNARASESLESIALDNLPSLKALDVSQNSSLDIMSLGGSLQHVSKTLEKLSMADLQDLSDENMPNLTGFENLRDLDLHDNRRITDAALNALPVLDHLDVLGCDELTDAGLKASRAREVNQYAPPA